jgi:choline dehydrogenase-like flavoprotein
MHNGKDNTQGVVNSFGDVYDFSDASNKTQTYKRLYIVDGAIVPTALGVNSSLTISALAFRIARKLVGIITTALLPFKPNEIPDTIQTNWREQLQPAILFAIH